MNLTTPPEHNSGRNGGNIGVFDSGVGGLSVLRSLRLTLQQHPLHYVADSAHAPYGERSEAHVVERSMRIARHLINEGASVIVIACNTATAVAAHHLRKEWPRLPIVGVEPGIKPALAASRSGNIGVMATVATLSSDKFQRLLNAHRGTKTIQLQACTGLAAAIEGGRLDSVDVKAMVEQYCKPLREACVDTVVLGCTHYPFVEDLIRAAMGPHVMIIDTADAVSRRVAHVVAEHAAPAAEQVHPPVVLQTTGSVATLERFAQRWLSFGFECRSTTLGGSDDGAATGLAPASWPQVNP